jgi:hypothetical protein
MARRRLGPARPGFLAEPPAGAPLPPRPAMPPIAQVAGEAAAGSAMLDLAETLAAGRAEGRLLLAIPLAEIDEGHLARDRMEAGDGEMAALVESIRRHGQRAPVEVAPLRGAVPWGLVSGWRRLQALRTLHAETGEARFARAKAIAVDPGSRADAYVAMVEENELRIGLSYYERARIAAIATDLGVFETVQDALRALFAGASRAKRSKIGSFLTLYRTFDRHLHWPARIPERLGLRLAARIRREGREAMLDAIADLEADTPEQEIAALEELLRGGSVSRAKQVTSGPGPAVPPATEAETLAPGLRLAVRRSGGRLSVTLDGPGLDEPALGRIRAALRALAGTAAIRPGPGAPAG